MAEQRGREMQSLQERVAYLEGRAEDHGTAITDLKVELREFRAEMNQRFDRVDARFDRMDARFGWLVGILVSSLVLFFSTLLGFLRP